MTAQHDCLEHLDYSRAEAVEPHGERHSSEWWECRVCGERYTAEELATLAEGL